MWKKVCLHGLDIRAILDLETYVLFHWTLFVVSGSC